MAALRVDDRSAFRRLAHHIFLPPKLPQEEDPVEVDRELLDVTHQALRLFIKELPSGNETSKLAVTAIEQATTALQNALICHDARDGSISEADLLTCLENCKENSTFPLRVRAQNAAVIITQRQDCIIFEAFELAPPNQDVLGTKGRLIRQFPGVAYAITAESLVSNKRPAGSTSAKLAQQPELAAVIAQTLATLSGQAVPNMQPQISKGRILVDEERDTTHPGMVTEFFLSGFIKAFSEPASVQTLQKHTRDDVLWKDAALPWRRSSTWLLIRVTIQSILSRRFLGSSSIYKAFMAYFMAELLETAQSLDIEVDLQYAMSCKLARRMQKINRRVKRMEAGVMPVDVQKKIARIQNNCNVRIADLWTAIRGRPRADTALLASCDFALDTVVLLNELDKFLEARSLRLSAATNEIDFVPAQGILRLPAAQFPYLPLHGRAEYGMIDVVVLEEWVQNHLQSCMARDTHSVCQELRSVMADVHLSFTALTQSNPEAKSLVLLIIMELWVALDKKAIAEQPLLARYDPHVPASILQNLLLPTLPQMQRLQKVESHLENRQRRATLGGTFSPPKQSTSFAVQFYEQSGEMQSLLTQIQKRAEIERAAKIAELEDSLQRYSDKRRDAAAVLHTFVTPPLQDLPNGYTQIQQRMRVVDRQHDPSCLKCRWEKEADTMKIMKHEWPLPHDTSLAKAVIFELSAPEWYTDWRDSLAFLLYDVLRFENKDGKPPKNTNHALRDDPHLGKYYPEHLNRRVVLWSINKAHFNTHRQAVPLSSATQANVCIENATYYHYLDSTTEKYLRNSTPSDTVAEECTYVLPERSKDLQQFLFRPSSAPDGPSPNMVIATQSSCPEHITAEEYKDLCSIPLGVRIQWQNMLVQLAAPSVDFKKEETVLFFFQSILQVGPSWRQQQGEVAALRASHVVLRNDGFAWALLESLDAALSRVKGSWDATNSVIVFVTIASRLLALNPDSAIQERCLQFLQQARDIALKWLTVLRSKQQRNRSQGDHRTFILKCVEVARLCGLTFSVGLSHLRNILQSVPNVSVLLQCAIVLGERRSSLSTLSGILQARLQQILYICYPFISANHVGIDQAVRASWPAYVPSPHGWSSLGGNLSFWLRTETAGRSGNELQVVHLNLLTGELLVDGWNLKCPPLVYQNHSSYKALFGPSSMEVVPSTEPGMRFSARAKYEGHEVHLGMSPKLAGVSRDLLVMASIGEDVLELVPSRLLRGKFPEHFLDRYIHWYSVKKDILLFRPADTPWSKAHEWKLSRTTHGGWQLQFDGTYLLGNQSLTCGIVSRILSPLVDPPAVQVTFAIGSGQIDVEIPHLQLGFTLRQGESQLMSNEYRDMYVDDDQSVGSLIGLQNKLALKSLKTANRKVLIPEGEVTYTRSSGHIDVRVDLSSVKHIRVVELDERLARLVDNGNFHSKLYLAYLHALTSFALSNPLTNRTGTEQALSILRSAAVLSFEQLSEEDIDLLVKLAELTPARSYYPSDGRSMQTVEWDEQLSFMSQHGDFAKAVQTILDQARRSNVFYPESRLVIPMIDHVVPELLDRDLHRTAGFRVAGFGAEHHSLAADTDHKARDCNETSDRAAKAFIISRIIATGSDSLHWQAPVAESLWPRLQHLQTVASAKMSLEKGMLRYDALHLKKSHEIGQHLLSLFGFLVGSNYKHADHFALAIWLATMAISDNPDLELIQTIAMFHTAAHMRAINCPDTMDTIDIHPARGRELSMIEIETVIRECAIPLSETDAVRLLRKDLNKSRRLAPMMESDAQFSDRQLNHYTNQVRSAAKVLANEFRAQWIQKERPAPAVPKAATRASCGAYIDVSKATADVTVYFRDCWNNREFYRFLAELEKAMCKLKRQTLVIKTWPLNRGPVFEIEEGHVFLKDIFSGLGPQASDNRRPAQLQRVWSNAEPTSSAPVTELKLDSVVKSLELSSNDAFETRYAGELRESLVALQTRDHKNITTGRRPSLEELRDHLVSCEKDLSNIYKLLLKCARDQLFQLSGDHTGLQWPRLSPVLFLEQLNRKRFETLRSSQSGERWAQAIVQYGMIIIAVQRAERLLNARKLDNEDDLLRELDNPGHADWRHYMSNSESLLLEVESGIMIRPVQEQIAAEMSSPTSGGNQVVQLNMGEGKSSVIVPLVAAGLANGLQLVRVVVAKPQSKQMAQMLISKLGGMLDRRIYYMPYSRALKLTKASAEVVEQLCQECMRQGGVLLLQPEHILSFTLTVPESYIAGNTGAGDVFLRLRNFFNERSRDVIDESDENFNVRFELIYTMGRRRPIQLAPTRWTIIQELLDLVRKYSVSLAHKQTAAFEIHARAEGGFPRVRVLEAHMADALMREIANDICENGLLGLPIARQSIKERRAIFEYITRPELNKVEVDAVHRTSLWSEDTKYALLLVRGLLAGGILQFVLCTKRWRVNYGLTSRSPATRLAVPYRAKDVPSPRSEYSHPDVVILLTSLSYYYGGLGNDDLFASFGQLMTSDGAEAEYADWVQDVPIAPEFRSLSGLNIRDQTQCLKNVFPCLRFSKAAIDYFLSHVVFPRELKEYPKKLSASGCDLARNKLLPTTGFSGTNDSKELLPLDIRQQNLDHQKHTNALVLEHLLQDGNGVALMPPISDTERTDAEQLLDMVVGLRPMPEVILDVGAQILELNNVEVARRWLKKCPGKKAVVYCNDNDELCVIDRRNRIDLLQVSSYASQLDLCLIYLDEVSLIRLIDAVQMTDLDYRHILAA